MKKIFLIFTVMLFVFSISAYSRSFQSIAVLEYPGLSYNLKTMDFTFFSAYMSKNHYDDKGTLMDYFVPGGDIRLKLKHLTPDTRTDYVFFSGLGDKGYIALSKNSSIKKIRQGDLGKIKNVKHYILSTSKSVDSINSWKKLFGGSLITLNGYKKDIFDGNIQNEVAKNYAKNVAKYDLNDSVGHITAWMNANASASYKMSTRWSAIGYTSSDKKNLGFYTTSENKKRTRSSYSGFGDKVKTYAQGRIELYKSPSTPTRRSGQVAENTSFKTRKENLSNIELLSMFNSRRSRNRNKDEKLTEFDNGLKNMKIFDSGALIYQDFSNEQSRGSLSFEENMQKAYEFVMANGGIPVGYKTTGMNEISYTDTETGKKNVFAHSITWEKELDGKKVRGNSGDAINVIIKNGQVVHYYRMCRVAETSTIQKEGLRRTTGNSLSKDNSILDFDTAIKKGQDDILSYLKTDKTIKIVDVNTVMHSPSYIEDNAVYKTAYELVLSDGNNIYISAEDGSVLY